MQCTGAAGSAGGDSSVGGSVGPNWASVTGSFWEVDSSGVNESEGGTSKITEEMNDIVTFSREGWNIIAVASGQADLAYIRNIVTGSPIPFWPGRRCLGTVTSYDYSVSVL